MSKLTLMIDNSVLETAQKYAKAQGKSLSNLIEDYLKTISKDLQTIEQNIELSPSIKSLLGSVKLSDNVNDKDMLADEIMKKYLK